MSRLNWSKAMRNARGYEPGFPVIDKDPYRRAIGGPVRVFTEAERLELERKLLERRKAKR